MANRGVGRAEILQRLKQEYEAYQALEDTGAKYFKLIGEVRETTCEVCRKHIGKTYSLDKIKKLKIYPPFHPNCRCRLEPVGLLERARDLTVRRPKAPEGILKSGDKEAYETSNEIVYKSLSDLDKTWHNLDLLEQQGIDIGSMKDEVTYLADYVREFGDSKALTEFDEWITGYGNERTNATEKVIYASNRVKGSLVGWASRVSSMLFGSEDDGTMGNAHLHAFWNALAVAYTGDTDYVRLFTNAHEYGTPINFTTAVPNSKEPSGPTHLDYTLMDFNNNSVGREIALESNSISDPNWRLETILKMVTESDLYITVN
ncbi:MAG: phage head morphogenesis protein [Oscillospiraceae bacterium]|jgi:hypothetical protein|nr:phage head morphogenesis protein [Oscillospiraceae bacterium]